MPSFTNSAFAFFYKRILQINQSSNTGVDDTPRKIQDGSGVDTSISVAKNGIHIQPENADITSTMLVRSLLGANIFAVDTINSKVKVGSSQVEATTQFKEMGLYEFSPNAAGYHYPLIANKVGMQGAEALTYDDDWGNGTDPPTTLDVSGLTDPENAIAIYWYLDNAITINTVRYMARADGSVTLNFHLFEYTLDTSTNHGDLSGGSVVANASVSATASAIKTGTFTIDSANVAAGKIIIAYVENVTDTSDISCALNIQYNVQ